MISAAEHAYQASLAPEEQEQEQEQQEQEEQQSAAEESVAMDE